MDPDQQIKPISEKEMASLMAALGPYEDCPHIAVAVSGGADSLALTLLAHDWARQKGGSVTALSVDHGLRPESALEVKQVAHWLAARGIEHRVLNWSGVKPKSGLQAAARNARYDLLGQWCRDAGVLHLLLAHHLEDQAETFLLRLKHNSGIDGLAAMAAIVEKPHMRLLRPLLGVTRERLRVTLQDVSQPWLEDPSNENTAFERVRIRKSLPELAATGITAESLAATASRMARARVTLEAHASSVLAGCCVVDPAGYLRLDAASLFLTKDEIFLRVLARALMCVGGGEYAPRQLKVERLHEKMKEVLHGGRTHWKGATLGRCRVLFIAGAGDQAHFLVCREGRFLPVPIVVEPRAIYDWDRRFFVQLDSQKNFEYQDVRLQALGREGWRELLGQAPEINACKIPAAVRLTLPTLVDDDGIVAVPHLNYNRVASKGGASGFLTADFHPRQTLSGTGFLVAQ